MNMRAGLTNAQKAELYAALVQEDRDRMPAKMKAFLKPCRFKFAYGGRGGGKSDSIAKILLKEATKKRIKVLCLREIQNSIADSVHTNLVEMISALEYGGFIITNNHIRHKVTGSEFHYAGLFNQVRTQSIKSYSGFNRVWIEEAQAVRKESLDILIPTIRKKESELWFSFNRLFPDDPVFILMNNLPETMKIVANINYTDNPYLPDVLKEQALLSKEEYEKGISDDYPHIWLGEPVGLSDRAILKLREVESAMNRTVEPVGAVEVGADIARYGTDRTVLIKRHGLKMVDMRVYKGLSVVETASYLKDFTGYNKTISIKVDDTGVGGGVTDILQADGYNVTPVNNGESALDAERYPNAISEMWFNLKGLINEVELLNNADLKAELIMREYDMDSKGRRRVESKDVFKKRYGKSPDLADALLLAYYQGNKRSNIVHTFKGLL